MPHVQSDTDRPASARPGELALIVAGALLFAAGFPPFDVAPAAALCLAPFAVVLARRADGGRSHRGTLLLGLLFGAIGYGVAIAWLPLAFAGGGAAGWIAFAAALLYLGSISAAVAVVLHQLRRRLALPMAVLLPPAWAAGELVLGHFPALAFPWLPLGLATAGWLPLVQAADLVGVRGLSFLLALVAGILADGWLAGPAPAPRWPRRAAAITALLLAVTGYGAWRMAALEVRPLARVAVVQPNVPATEKHDPRYRDAHVGRLARLSREAASSAPPDLVLWPETALAGFVGDQPGWRDTLAAVARATGAPVVTGAVDVRRYDDGTTGIFNAAVAMDVDGVLREGYVYHKRALVPVTERMPFVNPGWFTGGDLRASKGFGRGESPGLLALGFGAAAPLICFESAFPELAREARAAGAGLLLNLTNDAAFQAGGGARQHLRHLVVRAVETRLPVVRSANSGISAHVDPLGRVHGPTGFDEVAARTYAVSTTDVVTPYVRLGDWVAIASALATGALLVLAWLRGRGVSVVPLRRPR